MMEKELVFQDEVRKTEGVRSDFTGWSVRAVFVSVKARLFERKSYYLLPPHTLQFLISDSRMIDGWQQRVEPAMELLQFGLRHRH